MPRIPARPPLPDRPSLWLANFRYRLRGARGERVSPEALGYQLGVSGATVRRWETGQSNPSDEDLTRLAEACRLTAQQREFLHRLYGRHPFEFHGAPPCFRDEATRLLEIEKPAYLVDELFYVRAWNSYYAAMVGPLADRLPSGLTSPHMAFLASPYEDAAAEFARRQHFVRLTWMWTAHLGTTPEYTELVRDLFSLEGFTEHWQDIVDEISDECQPPLIMPLRQREVGGGSYLVSMCEAVFPPVYRLFEYDADDDVAETWLRRQVQAGPPQVEFADRLHWSEQ